jgi:hypothetical protein
MDTNTMNTIENISIDKLATLEIERETTMADKEFQQWCKDMHIGQLHTNRESIDNANAMMAQWSEPLTESEKMWPDWIRRMY